ncbi:hypothetical protein P5V15_015075 [Pogonomyrmex californicus]
MPRRTHSILLRLEDVSCTLIVIMANMHQCWELTSEQKIYAKTYLNETDKIRKNVVAEIKRWLEKNKNLCARTDKNSNDISILQYLRIYKFDIEETKIRIQNYHKLRSDISEWYANKDPFQPELQAILDLGMFFFLRKPDNQERSVFFTRPYLYDPKINKLSDVIKIGIMMWDLGLRDYVEASIYGYVIYIDLSGLDIDHVAPFESCVMINLIHLWQKYPENFISINYLEDKLHSFRTTEDSSNHIPTNTLPNEYGGTVQELTNNWKKLVEENRNFIDDEKYKKYKTLDQSTKITERYTQISTYW